MRFDEHKCLFFHVSKAAGTSIEHLLNTTGRDLSPENAGTRQPDSLFGWCPSTGIYLQHATAETVKRLVGDEVFDTYYKFSIVRNPFDRLRSEFDYNKPKKSFEQFVLELPSRLQHPAIELGAHATPQYKYTDIGDETVCDNVFRYEDLDNAKRVLIQKFQLVKPLLHHNRSSKKSQPIYSTQMVEIITRAYKRDFEQFGYPLVPPPNTD